MAAFNRIQIDIPRHWLDNTEIQLIEPDPKGAVPASIVLSRFPLEEGMTPELLQQALTSGVESTPECELLRSELTEIGGWKAHRIDMRIHSDTTPVLRRIQTAVFTDPECLMLICTGPEASFAEHGPLFERAVGSLRVEVA